ncbi:hydrogenase maturation nickel metallochaperone HypA [bacterium]|nr:hydrogenase maturation nickel metallochaperone HypA [bacterium]
MHELGIVFHIIDTLEEVGRENHLASIQSVTVELGEVSTVIPEYLTDCWNWAVKKRELLKEAVMHVEVLPAVTLCRDCGKEYGTVEHGRICPWCGNEKTHLVRGSEINIKQIEAY